jgi:thymidine phosphorylase
MTDAHTLDARRIIADLRDGRGLSAPDALAFAKGLADGSVSDAQGAAFAMAGFLRGLTRDDRVALTLAMRDSGAVLSWDLPGPVVDKHSTGGVGDVVSLILAPALAACGAFNPMVSGRGLGHTGGTLDKLEAIPGLTTEVPEDRFRAITRDIGCAIVAASRGIAPADRRLYALRDVTSTVESIDLITASILSKKLAAGLQVLVLDVKVGSGAFMRTAEQAQALAVSLVDTANGAGCRTSALITDMNQPLARTCGNALEVAEAMAVLSGDLSGGRLMSVTADLGGEALALAGLATGRADGAARIRQAVASGAAMDRFARMVAALGGPADFAERWATQLPAAPVVVDVPAPRAGFLTAWNGFALGECVVHLGGGRLDLGQTIDPAVGLSHVAELGTRIAPGDPIARVHAATADAAARATATVQAAATLADTAPAALPLVHATVT